MWHGLMGLLLLPWTLMGMMMRKRKKKGEATALKSLVKPPADVARPDGAAAAAAAMDVDGHDEEDEEEERYAAS